MTIYTRTGDRGETGLLGAARAPKDSPRLEVCGDLDEFDALLGLARCEPMAEDVAVLLERIQRRMVAVRAEAVAPATPSRIDAVGPPDIEELERAIDLHDANLEPLTTFIVPGGSRAAAVLHVARAVCRRAERRLVSLARAEPSSVSPSLSAYVNRLSDLLFVLARSSNAQAGHGD
ncbi:MAG: cob(I)yrinic acid a,c-diamide adenosyltransferase [Planctomycetes bacterium]|nr:cob(I)yrinic acid a,c-diamide adenosyltransferase [Planctomycetota bacterium]MBU4400879.1 cob(I)yrinic acid a,c-diamide adenosyltransferase [Planctomycetota bacterium]MCG2682406.1 cob(I)yrinic acid a,c-diamide adenosyltransferase [Planctomycetales bacterium]